MKAKYNGWMVQWTMKITSSPKDRYEEHVEIFIEYDEMEASPQQQARQLFDHLKSGLFDDDYTEIYTANLCEIKESTEAHYTDIQEPE